MSMLDFYMVTEVMDYVCLGSEQPKHLQHDPDGAFEFETPHEEGNFSFSQSSFQRPNGIVMSMMPRKISFYMITGGVTTLCFVFLETIARAEPGSGADLSRKTGSTVIWQQKPTLVQGMHFLYFLLDCLGAYEPPPMNSHVHHSYLEKQENNRKLVRDGQWAICTFFRTIGALTQFTISAWNERSREMNKKALSIKNHNIGSKSIYLQLEPLAKELHMHLDELYFHYEKSNLPIRLAKTIIDSEAGNIVLFSFLNEYVRSSEYELQCFDRLERKIKNTIELVSVLSALFVLGFQVPMLGAGTNVSPMKLRTSGMLCFTYTRR